MHFFYVFCKAYTVGLWCDAVCALNTTMSNKSFCSFVLWLGVFVKLCMWLGMGA